MHPDYPKYEKAAQKLPLEQMGELIPGFSPPTQQRTRIKTARMIAVATCLLRDRNFGDISVQEIADASSCSVTSIYARFQDKEAMLPAILFLILSVYGQRLDDHVEKKKYENKTLEDFSNDLIFVYDYLFVTHANFVKAVMISQAGDAIRRTDDLLDALAIKATVIAAALVGRSQEDTISSVSFAMRVALSVFRDRAMAGDFVTGIDKESLATLFAMIIRTNLSDRR